MTERSVTVCAFAAGRGNQGAVEEEDGAAVFLADQDDDDDHVKLLNPVKVKEALLYAPCMAFMLLSVFYERL